MVHFLPKGKTFRPQKGLLQLHKSTKQNMQDKGLQDIGETGRQMRTLIKEHKKAILKADLNNAIATQDTKYNGMSRCVWTGMWTGTEGESKKHYTLRRPPMP